MKIKNNLCVKKPDGTIGLPASATLALFDELSSYAAVIKDRTCRFGVSVFLTTELVGDIPAGRWLSTPYPIDWSLSTPHSLILTLSHSVMHLNLCVFACYPPLSLPPPPPPHPSPLSPTCSDVIVSVKATKIGKTLGFITMEMFDSQDRLVAHGRHIKYAVMTCRVRHYQHPQKLSFFRS